MEQRLTRRESRARTQERLLDAATKVLIQRGFEAASVEDIAETAGFSRGAFYSNFESKEALALQLYGRFIRERVQGVRDVFTAVQDPVARLDSLRDYFRSLVKDWESCVLAIEFRLFAMRHPALHTALREIFRTETQATITYAGELFDGAPHPSPMLPADLVIALIAAEQGLALQHMMDPEGITLERLDRIAQIVFDRLTGAAVDSMTEMFVSATSSPQRKSPTT
jgi:AcrR family transcriptional regulator